MLLCLSPAHSNLDSLTNFQRGLWRELSRNIGFPPEVYLRDTCFHYTDLIKVEINKSSKVVSIQFSDSAPEWLKKDLDKSITRKYFNFKILDSLAIKDGLRNCTFVFPYIIESGDFPCGQAKKRRTLNSNFFKFDGKNLKGNILFGEELANPISIIGGIKN